MNSSLVSLCRVYAKENDVPLFRVLLDFLSSRIFYGFSIDDYFKNSDGITISGISKRRFFSEHKCLNIQNKYNDRRYLQIYNNKVEFLKFFHSFITHKWCYPKDVSFDEFYTFINSVGKVIAKPIEGIGKGTGVHIYNPSKNMRSDYEYFCNNNYLLEEFITQHPLMEFGGFSVNTLRIYSIVDIHGESHILKAILRVGVGDSTIDSYSQGGVIYPINIVGGFVEGYGVRKCESREIYVHPGTDIMMLGYKIPYWSKVVETIKVAARKMDKVRYLGWDVAITENGIDLIEANPDGESGMMERIGFDRYLYPKIMKFLKGSKS